MTSYHQRFVQLGLFVTLTGIKAAWIRSDQAEEERAELYDKFNDPKEDTLVLVGAAKLLGTGMNLQQCHVITLVQPLNSISAFLQTIGRVLRLGQTSVSQIYSLCTNNSFDETRHSRNTYKFLPMTIAGGSATSEYIQNTIDTIMASKPPYVVRQFELFSFLVAGFAALAVVGDSRVAFEAALIAIDRAMDFWSVLCPRSAAKMRTIFEVLTEKVWSLGIRKVSKESSSHR